MKILLDECITKRLKRFLYSYDVFTVSEMKWNGIKNGKLLSLATDNGFDILLTIDKNIKFQQNLQSLSIRVVVLDSPTATIRDLQKFIPRFQSQMVDFKPGNFYVITI